MLPRASDIGHFHDHCRKELVFDAEMPLLRVRCLVLETVALHAWIGGNQLRRRLRLHQHDGRKRVVDGPDERHIERVGLGGHVLRDDERHVETVQVAGRMRIGKVRDAISRPEDGPATPRHVERQSQARRKVEVVRLLVRGAARAVLAGVDEPVVRGVVVCQPVLVLRGRAEDLVAHAGIDRQTIADFEVVLDEGTVLDDAQGIGFDEEPATTHR